MLKPCQFRLLWRRRKQEHSIEAPLYSKMNFIIVVIGCLTLLPLGFTQQNDDVYIVQPTPALQLGKEVLLVNNENHGRYINVRPEIGLLTSTARTFVQEGVITEYATQLVGTTLDNGRVYAQYLKKSSRVLYDSAIMAPSVVTSWVGESLHSVAESLPQSHNELSDADKPDWQAIDDHLLVDHRRKMDFIGNTDYVNLARKSLSSSYNRDSEDVAAPSVIGNTKNYKLIDRLDALDEDNRNKTSSKILPVGDLSTYTVRPSYEPSAYLISYSETELGRYNGSNNMFGRSPKQIYKNFMKNNLNVANLTEFTPLVRPAVLRSRHFATVTYYGFSDFTTVVGDSVIVFSPSTSTNNLNYKAYVTSIKGEATLGASLLQSPSISKVAITVNEDLIEPTVTEQPTVSTKTTNTPEAAEDASLNSLGFTSTEAMGNKSTEMEHYTSVLETSEIALQQSQISMPSPTLTSSVILSRPSDEEVLRIYNALANANANKMQIQSTMAENITSVLASSISKEEAEEEEAEEEEHIETPNVQTFEGATTIFFEDDPFSNFVMPTKISSQLEATTDSRNSVNISAVDVISKTTTHLLQENKTEVANIYQSTEITLEPDSYSETSTGQSLNTQEENLDRITTTEPVKKPSTHQDSSDILPNVVIKEIDPVRDEEVPSDCVSTSQVFLTQLPKTITLFETVVMTAESGLHGLQTEIKQKVQPTFEIKEATKHYCIQASATPNQIINSSLPITEKIDAVTTTYGAEQEYVSAEVTDRTKKEDEQQKMPLNATEEINLEVTTEQPNETEDVEKDFDQDISADVDAYNANAEEARNQSKEVEEDEEEVELIYKTLYTTYTYLTTFFHDDSTSTSSHIEVVTNVLTSTLGINVSQASTAINTGFNLEGNAIQPTLSYNSKQMETTARFVVPTEVESLIRTDEETRQKVEDAAVRLSGSILNTETLETLATLYTTYTYYTTIFAEGETELMSHTEVITNYKKSTVSASSELEEIMPTLTSLPYMSQTIVSIGENVVNVSHTYGTELSSSLSNLKTLVDDLPNIPDFGELSAITLVTDVRTSSSPGNKQIINKFLSNISMDKFQQPQQQSIFEDQISSESNTDADEIIPSATLLLQTSFTTFTYYTTMYSGDKTNVISRLETITNTMTETLQPTATIDLEKASIPVTYFTTFTYWTKLAREGQITTLSREEIISNIITPTVIQQQTQSQPANQDSDTEKLREEPNASNLPLTLETSLHSTNENKIITVNPSSIVATENSLNLEHVVNVLEPTTYYTTYTYYTTSYETDKTITDSRFETITNIITPTVTLSERHSNHEDSLINKSPIAASSPTLAEDQVASELLLYDFKKIIDADGISTIFFTTEIKPTINADGVITEVVSSASSLLVDEGKRDLQLTAEAEKSTPFIGDESQVQKQYKTGLVRFIEGTRIANRTTTLYQSKVIGTIINQRYAQIIESTSSFIFEKTNAPGNVSSEATFHITPTSMSDISIMQATAQVSPNSLKEKSSSEQGRPQLDVEEELSAKSDEKLRFPFQAKKPPFISPLKPFSNRNRPQFAPKKNSSATIITRSDFTPTITATPALKTLSRFSSSKGRGGGISGSSAILSSRRFGRPKSSVTGGGFPISSTSLLASTRNRFVSSSTPRLSFASSSRRLGSASAIVRPSFPRPPLLSSGYAGNSRPHVKLSTVTSATVDTAISSSALNSEEEIISEEQEESADEEENITESNRRQNNPLLRLRRPLNRPQGFTPSHPQPNYSNRRNPFLSHSRNGNSASSSTTTTTTTAKPKPRTFQPPAISLNRNRPTNSLFPPRNIFGVKKSVATTTEENRNLVNEEASENIDDSEYEDDEEEDSDGDEEEETSRRRRSNNETETMRATPRRGKREAGSLPDNRSNFRNRFKRPKLISSTQSDSRSIEDNVNEGKETVTTPVPLMLPTQKKRSRFGARYLGHTTTASTSPATPHNPKAIRPTRPNNNSGGRSQFTLREKDSPVVSVTQKALTSAKRPPFRRPQPGGSAANRRLPSSTAASTSSNGKRRLKNYTNNDAMTTSRNSVTGRNRPSTTTGRSRSSTSSRDSNGIGKNRGRNNHNYNNNNNEGIALDNSGTIIVTHITPAEVTIPVVNGKVTEYKQVITAKTSTEVLGPQQYKTAIAANGLPQLFLTREDSSVNYNGATEVTKYLLHETPTTTITFTPTTIRGRKTSFSHVLPSTVYSVEKVVSTVQSPISSNAPLANILLSQLLLGNVALPVANQLLGALGGTATSSVQQGTPITEYKTHASTYVTTIFEGQSTVLPVTFQGKKILTTIFDTTAQTITATEFVTDTIITTPTVMAQPQPVVNSLLLQQLLLQQQLQQQQQIQQPAFDPSSPINAIANPVPQQFLLGGDNLQELEASNNIRSSGNGDLLNEEDELAIVSSVDFDDNALQPQAPTHRSGRKKTRKNASQETYRHSQLKSGKFLLRGSAPFKNLHDYNHSVSSSSSSSSSNKNVQEQDVYMDEARYNLATRIMSNGVEVIIASDKTKPPDHIVPDISNSQVQFNKPMTLAASTIKNQMLILPFTSSLTSTDNGLVLEEAHQQLSHNLAFQTNHFITKTCLTTYTYRTTYIKDGRTTVESREKVISNIATEERNYPKISPTQPVGVTLTKTPEIAVGIFPTTYSYYNTFRDKSDKWQVMTSEYIVVNTITGPNEYLDFLQSTVQATPTLNTNTYYNEITFSQKLETDMQTVKRNLTQVVVTKSYTPAHSGEVLTSYYASDGLEGSNVNVNSPPISAITNEGVKEAVSLYIDATELPDDIHIYATKTFLTTFTYYTTTVLSKYLTEGGEMDLGVKPLSTVFNYYTRVMEYVVREGVPASLLPNGLLENMKMELGKQQLNKDRRLIVTTATLKDGQTVQISAIESYKFNATSNAITLLLSAYSKATQQLQPAGDAIKNSEMETEDKYQIPAVPDTNEEDEVEESENQTPNANLKVPASQLEANENNDFATLASEQMISVVAAPNKPTEVFNDKPSTSASNQLIQHLTALKPMFHAVADLLQNKFGITRDATTKPTKNIATPEALNITTDANQPIYIPVQKSAIKNNPYEFLHHMDPVPQSLHIKPPLFMKEPDSLEINAKHSSLTVTRQAHPLHNGAIYIRPGEIITANSDVIIGRPNGLNYAQLANQIHIKNASKPYSLDSRPVQVSYYHNQVQHPYKKKTVIGTSLLHKPQQIPIGHKEKSANIYNKQPLIGLLPPKEQTFNKNILKPPPLPPAVKPLSLAIPNKPDISLTLTAPDKLTVSRNRNKPQTTAESTSSLQTDTPHVFVSLMQKLPRIPSSVPPLFRAPQTYHNFHNEILEIQAMPQIYSATVNSISRPITNVTGVRQKLNFGKGPSTSNLQNIQNSQMKLKPESNVLQPGKETFQKLVANTEWRTVQELPIKNSTSTPYKNLDHKTKEDLSRKSKPAIELTGYWQMQDPQHHHNSQIAKPSTLQISKEPTNPFTTYQSSRLITNQPKAATSSSNLGDMENLTSTHKVLNKPKTSYQQGLKESKESVTKNHQNVSLDKHVFTHTVNVNVPPLTFKRDHDYPKQAAAAVRGQILPARVKELKTPALNIYKYMPLIKIPADEQQVQVSLTPSNSINTLTLPFELPDASTWNTKAVANDDSHKNINLNRQQLDQKTLPANIISSLTPQLADNSKWHPPYKRQELSSYSRLTPAKPVNTAKNENFRTTLQPNTELLKTKFLADSQAIQSSAEVHIKSNNSYRLGLKEHSANHGTEAELSQVENRTRKVTRQEINEKLNETLDIFGTKKNIFGNKTVKPEDFNDSNNLNNKEYQSKKLTQIVTQDGYPFRKPTDDKRDENHKNNKEKSNQTLNIYVASDEAFGTTTNAYNEFLKISSHTTEQVSAKEEKTDTLPYYNKTFAEVPIKNSSQLKSARIDTETLQEKTTESVFGLKADSLLITNTKGPTIKPVSQNYSQNYSSFSTEKYPEITQEPKTNKTHQIIFNITKALTEAKTTAVKEQNILAKHMEIRKSLNNPGPTRDNIPKYYVNKEGVKPLNLQTSATVEPQITTKTPTLVDTSNALTTAKTTTVKRLVSPSKSMTNKGFVKVTTIELTPAKPSNSKKINQQTTNLSPAMETTTQPKINTTVNNVTTALKALEAITITTTFITPATEISKAAYAIKSNFTNLASETFLPTTKPSTLVRNKNLNYLPHPSVEVVSANVTPESALYPNENSIFIIMTNNKDKKNKVFPHETSSEFATISQEISDLSNIQQIPKNEVLIEYDNGITFDDIPMRYEEPEEIVNVKSVANNMASAKDISSDGHIILGEGVLITSPPKFPTTFYNSNNSNNASCYPPCKASRNEKCGLVGNNWSCLCRPGFARMFQDRPCKPTYTYNLLLHVERVGNYPLQYVTELKDNRTEHYNQLSKLVNNALDRMIMQSDFRDSYHGVEVGQYADDEKNQRGILINIILQLSDNSNEKRLAEVFKKYLRLSNYSIGETDLYTNKAGLDALTIKDFNECVSRKFHDCSENAHCFNLPGTYTCSCMEGFADLSDNPIYPGRICSADQIGCEMCHYHGKCSSLKENSNKANYCECFPWYAGSKCRVNLKILLIVLLGIGTLLFILLLFCILITCTKRRNHQHMALAPSTLASSSEVMQKKSQFVANTVITSIGLRSSLRGIKSRNPKRQSCIEIDKCSMIKYSSSEGSQNSLPYVLKNKESIVGSCSKKKSCILKQKKKLKSCSSLGNTKGHCATPIPFNIQKDIHSDLNTVTTTSSSFKGNKQPTEKQNLLGNISEYEGLCCEQSDRSLTVMIPRAKYHSSVLAQTQLLHHQLTLERIYKTEKLGTKLETREKPSEAQRNYKTNSFTGSEIAVKEKCTKIPSNPGALISAGFEVSAIVKDNATKPVNVDEQQKDLVRFDSIISNYMSTSDPATSLDSNATEKHFLSEDKQSRLTHNMSTLNNSHYNINKCDKDLIETMDEWLGNAKLKELSAEARSFDETTVRASTKPLRTSAYEISSQQMKDEINPMTEWDLDSTFLLPHTHLYKPERESELSGFDSF